MIEMTTAFISSTGDLVEERRKINDKLIDARVFPYAMEHFAVASIEGFEDIKILIDNSDYFFLILGCCYGTREYPGGLSWTQKEFEYCKQQLRTNKTKVYAIQLPQLTKMIEQYDETMSDEEVCKLDPNQSAEDIRAQIRFALSLEGPSIMKKSVSSSDKLGEEVYRFVEMARDSGSVKGWIRGIPQKEYMGVKFGKKYYQVHLSDTDRNYLRMGTVKFSRVHGSIMVKAEGKNYKSTFSSEKNKFVIDKRNTTEWVGTYLVDNHKFMGVYSATKYGDGTYANQTMKPGVREGIHTFEINLDRDEWNKYRLSGRFQDAASLTNPDLGCKTGWLFIFDKEEDRLEFLKEDRPELFK